MAFDPYSIAERGRKIYDRLRRNLEAEHPGQFVIIDTSSERFFLGESPEVAFRAAREAKQDGPFHCVRVGHTSVYRSTRLRRWPRRAAS